MQLSCDGWYTLVCKRLRDEQSREQDVPFTFLSALHQGFFHDGYLKSLEGHQVNEWIYYRLAIIWGRGMNRLGDALRDDRECVYEYHSG